MDRTVSDILIGQATVGTTPVMLAPMLSDYNKEGVLVKAHGSGDAAANTDPVYVGTNNQVTSGSGFSLGPGEAVVVPYREAIWAVSTASSQAVSFIEA